MQFSVQLFGLPPAQYLPLTQRAEQLGFHTVWLADHVVTPVDFERKYPYSPGGNPGYTPQTPLVDVGVTLGFLAASTERIALASGVFVLPMRNPFHVARTFAAVQNLSLGRLTFGVGAGWMAEEFDAVGEDFRHRGARMDEMLDVLELLWSGEQVEFHGTFFDFGPLHFAGAPEQAIPVVFGGHTHAALRRAARRGNGWFGPNVDLDASLRLMATIETERERLGRRERPFTHFVRMVGEASAATVQRYAAAGVEHLVFSPFTRTGIAPTLSGRLAALDRVALDVGVTPSA